MIYYHAHIYWRDDEQRSAAIALRDHLDELGGRLGRVHDQPVGPHPLPMYQVKFDERSAPAIEQLLSNQGITVLLHEDTSDDVRDHTEGARWINGPLALDIEYLRSYQENHE